VSTHELPHKVNVPAQPEAHWLCEQTNPAPHALPHPPQFLASDDVSTQAPEHVACAVAQPHAPPWQPWPAEQA
jgi:hypothetical protein